LKNSGLFAFSLTLYLIADFSSSWGSETETFKKADSGKEITVRAGDVIRIELQQAGATGYLWEPHDLDTEHFKVVSMETREDVGSEITGAPVVRIWSIKALKKGKSELRFFYYRPWKG
jgi:predicted secreted protein